MPAAVPAGRDDDGADTPRTLRGGCLCGAVAYRVTDGFTYALNCRCSACRRAAGAAFKPFAAIPVDGLRLETGAEAVLRHGDKTDHDVPLRAVRLAALLGRR